MQHWWIWQTNLCPIDKKQNVKIGGFISSIRTHLCLKLKSLIIFKKKNTGMITSRLFQCCIRCGPDEERILDVVPREDGTRHSG